MQSFESYLTTEAGLSPNTVAAYLFDVREYLDIIQKDPSSECLINQFVKNLEGSLHPNTIKRKQTSLRCYYRYLISNGAIDKDILDTVDPLKSIGASPKIIEPEEMTRMLDHLSGPNEKRDRAIILLLCRSALRVSELCSLTINCVSFSNKMIKVHGKGVKDRVVPTTQDCIDAIQSYVDESKSDDSLIFNIGRSAVTDMITRTAYRSGIKHITAHTLRHSCATDLMNKDVPIDMIQTLLGHNNLDTTQKYLKISLQRLKKVHSVHHPRL